MKWRPITSIDDVNVIIDRSRVIPCLIFKHSTRCPISTMAKSRMEMNWDLPEGELEAYFLDLIQYREVSNFIASEFGVTHQSPQALVIKDGQCTYDASHLSIQVADLRAA